MMECMTINLIFKYNAGLFRFVFLDFVQFSFHAIILHHYFYITFLNSSLTKCTSIYTAL